MKFKLEVWKSCDSQGSVNEILTQSFFIFDHLEIFRSCVSKQDTMQLKDQFGYEKGE